MLKKNGFTILELIVAVGLISIVILFLYSLLSDVKNEITNNSIAVNNQLTRFEIIKLIQNDKLNEEISDIIIDYNLITITYKSSLTTSVKIDYENNSVSITDKSNLTTSWIMNENCYLGGISEIKINDNIDYTFYKFNIFIYTTNELNNEENNNEMDDIIFQYVDIK